jgi:hypothetical protein
VSTDIRGSAWAQHIKMNIVRTLHCKAVCCVHAGVLTETYNSCVNVWLFLPTGHFYGARLATERTPWWRHLSLAETYNSCVNVWLFLPTGQFYGARLATERTPWWRHLSLAETCREVYMYNEQTNDVAMTARHMPDGHSDVSSTQIVCTATREHFLELLRKYNFL